MSSSKLSKLQKIQQTSWFQERSANFRRNRMTPQSSEKAKATAEKGSEVSAILDIAVAIPQHFIKHETLAASRGVDANKYTKGLGCLEMAVCGPGEDTVTLAAEAGWRLLEHHPKRRLQIGLCIVATESAVDGSKPISIYIHELLNLSSTCRVFEIKHACYGGTAALQMASTWTQANPSQLALVITSDIARYAVGSAGEPTQGAGAVAMLVGPAKSNPSLLKLSTISGIHAQQVYDFWRPNYQNWAEVKGKYSVDCYLKSLEASYQHYHLQAGKEETPEHMLFHVPFPKMARKGHTCLLAMQGITDEATIQRDYEARVLPGLWANQRVGNIYTGSLYLALAALCEKQREHSAGERVGIYSYGSGSCSEYFTGVFGEGTYHPHLQQLLHQRKEVDTETYEALMKDSIALEQNQSYDPTIASGQPFRFVGIRNHERIYVSL